VSAEARESVALGAGFGYGLFVATLCAALAALPAALRASSAGASLPMAWLALWGAAALMSGPIAGAWRVARPLSAAAWSLPLGLALSLAPLLVFARVLKSATHHRPLGGATFAIVAALLVLGATAVAARVIAFAGKRQGALAKAPLALGLAGCLLAVPLAMPLLGAGLRASALDGLLLVAGVAAGALAPERPGLGRVGLVVWVLAVALGLGLGLGAAETRAALADRAPVLLGLAGWLRP